MNKRFPMANIISIIAIVFALYSFMTLAYKEHNNLNILIIPFFFGILSIMFILKKRIKHNTVKMFYNTILTILIISLIIIFIYISYLHLRCLFSNACFYENGLSGGVPIFYASTLIIMLILNVIKIKENVNKTDQFLLVIVSLILVFVHIRYYINIKAFDVNYITQNYFYFFILYLVLIIRKLINKI